MDDSQKKKHLGGETHESILTVATAQGITRCVCAPSGGAKAPGVSAVPFVSKHVHHRTSYTWLVAVSIAHTTTFKGKMELGGIYSRNTCPQIQECAQRHSYMRKL